MNSIVIKDDWDYAVLDQVVAIEDMVHVDQSIYAMDWV